MGGEGTPYLATRLQRVLYGNGMLRSGAAAFMFQQHEARCRAHLAELERVVAATASMPYVGFSATGPFIENAERWLRDALRSASVPDGTIDHLAPPAIRQIQSSLALRLVAEDGWAGSRTAITGMDSAVTGSIARWEAAIRSDFDFDFVAENDAELASNSLPRATFIDTAVEDARTAVLDRGLWWRRFTTTATRMYDFSQASHHGYALGVPDFTRATLEPMELAYERYGSNYLSSTFDLRATDRRLADVRSRATGIDRFDLARKKVDAARDYLGRLRDTPHPHPAHGVVSQLWQGLLYLVRGQSGARAPYWCAPLVFPMGSDSLQQWMVLMVALDVSRRGGSSTFVENNVIRGLLELFKTARGYGLAPTGHEALKNALLRRKL